MSKTLRHSIASLKYLAVSLFISFSINANSEPAKSSETTTPSVKSIKQGMMAPDFTLTRLDGTQFKLSDYRHKKSVYMVFWTTWCTYCMEKIPKLKYTQAVLGKQIEIIAIDTSVKDSFKKMAQFQQDRNINYPLAFDFGKKVTDLYGVWGTPTEFIIDINGKIVHRDHVPYSISEHLSNWNMIDHRLSQKSLMANNKCDKDPAFC
ncbi:MAG: TlpA disulfide reductase family protein [Enterobacterales bacterium]|nr:TlpA disulfide reductase family protein [Enterobacterales bacterium]